MLLLTHKYTHHYHYYFSFCFYRSIHHLSCSRIVKYLCGVCSNDCSLRARAIQLFFILLLLYLVANSLQIGKKNRFSLSLVDAQWNYDPVASRSSRMLSAATFRRFHMRLVQWLMSCATMQFILTSFRCR